MRILQINSAEAFGGGERHLVDLGQGLVNKGHELYFAVRPNSELGQQLNFVPSENLKTLPLRNALDVPTALSLSRLIKRERIDIVHAHLARDYPLAAYAVRNTQTAKLVLTRHVLFPLNPLHKVILSRAAQVIAVSEAVGVQLRNQGIVPRDRIVIIPNGIDLSRFEKAKEQSNRERACQSLGLEPNRLLVGTVGELKPQKGHEDFVRAAARVRAILPEAFFIIAGVDNSPGETYRTDLRALIERLHLESDFLLMGWLEDVAPLFCVLDLFVSASLTESFGLAIVEAMACGTPVVSTNSDGARQTIGDSERGLLVPVGDEKLLSQSIVKFLANGELRKRLGKAGNDYVKLNYSLEQMIDATEAVYLRVLRG